ncbi:senescence-associated carboxylesterase 101-like [Abrus precatorius]|uniref:Senescence-associated carboxylesterase 101-like n=1 Tax=Abrus precatorius TaxID=3816 RepID=A0A8B8LU31_ABRPR|nr:senescence-associated carboxylesterase 101-like [Abrus precatorius]
MAQSALGRFSCGIEIAPFVISSGLLHKSLDVIMSRYEGIITNMGEGLSWKVYKEIDSDLTIMAFEARPDFSNLQVEVVPSSALKEMNFHQFDFLCSKTNPIFCVNSTAFLLFYKNLQELFEWKKSEIKGSTPLIITGHGLGGSVASLFTISLLGGIGSAKNRPLCITYGSPLIGDKKLQQAISRSSNWNSCFLHVVSLKDPLPRLFITNHSSSASASTPQTSAYNPVGTFLLCSDENCTCFENPDSVLELLKAFSSIHVQNQGFQSADYRKILENLNHKALCKDFTIQVENMTRPDSILAVSINSQLRALGLTPNMQKQQQNIDINNLEIKMKRLEEKSIMQRRVLFDSFKKLNQMKGHMAQLEWYKKQTKNQGIGYYDSYKNMKALADGDVVVIHKNLVIYWEKMVEKAKIKPQKGGAAFRKSWLYAGTSYRRMVEPLTIAEYYRQGGKDYVINRPQHFVLLEEWFKNETTKVKWNSNRTSSVDTFFTVEDSHFWECVEKALISRQQSMVVPDMEENLNILSDEENEEPILTLHSKIWARVDEFLLSSKELKVVNEDEENRTSEKNDKDYSCFVACVEEAILSRGGSKVVREDEESLRRFGSRVGEAFLSFRESKVFQRKEENINKTRKKNVEAILTIDSCFWAHVEEALLSCQELKVVKEKEETLMKLVKFEEYVYGLLENYEVSSEIFLAQSSYMHWWNEYMVIKGTSYVSKLTSFMKDPSKRVRYALGAYDFPNSLEL